MLQRTMKASSLLLGLLSALSLTSILFVQPSVAQDSIAVEEEMEASENPDSPTLGESSTVAPESEAIEPDTEDSLAEEEAVIGGDETVSEVDNMEATPGEDAGATEELPAEESEAGEVELTPDTSSEPSTSEDGSFIGTEEAIEEPTEESEAVDPLTEEEDPTEEEPLGTPSDEMN